MIENIVIMEDSSKSEFGGGQKITLEVIKILFPNYKLFLTDCKRSSYFQQQAIPFIAQTLKLPCYGKITGSETSSFALGKLEVFLFPFLFLLSVVKMLRFLQKNRLTSTNTRLYATTKKTLLMAYFLKNILGIDYIFHAHSFDDRTRIFFKLIHPALKKSTKIIAVSRFIQENIKLPQCVTVHNPIGTLYSTPKNISGKKPIVIATFSTLVKMKGIDYFMESFKFLKNRKDVFYWIFGSGPEQEYLQHLQNDNVILKGFIKNSEELMLRTIDIVVVPSIAAEACPMVPLEAFACGVPVISTNIGGQAEIVVHNVTGFHIPIKSPEAIANRIDYLIDHNDRYYDMSNASLQYAKQFNSTIFTYKILSVFHQ